MKNVSTIGDNVTLRDLPVQKLCDWTKVTNAPQTLRVGGTVLGPGDTHRSRGLWSPLSWEGKIKQVTS